MEKILKVERNISISQLVSKINMKKEVILTIGYVYYKKKKSTYIKNIPRLPFVSISLVFEC